MHQSEHHDHLAPAAIPAQSLERLTKAIDKLNQRYSFWYALLHGISIGIGSTIGVALVLWVIIKLLTYLDFIPGVEAIREAVRPYLDGQ